MGMLLKPSKCRSCPKMSGYSPHSDIPSITYKEKKFLGKVVFFTGNLKKTLSYFTEIFKAKLGNINSAMVRGEINMWIYIFHR